MIEVQAGPSVTVVIPTRNGMAWLRESLDVFLRQEYPGKLDFLLIDSGSTDGTPTLQESNPGVRVHGIPKEEFGHGTTRNLALALCESELLLFTVQDACPRHPLWVRDMVTALVDHQLDAVCGGQATPHHPDHNPIEWYFPARESKKVEVLNGGEFVLWEPEKQLQRCGWDNVNALYKREALLKHPFERVRFGEDMRWAKDWLTQGGRIGFAPHCKVWHHHHHSGDYTRRRVLNTLYWRWRVFNVAPPLPIHPSVLNGIRTAKILLWNRKIRNPKEFWKWWRYNLRKSRGAHTAGREFASALASGPEKVEHLYESLGKTSPQAVKAP